MSFVSILKEYNGLRKNIFEDHLYILKSEYIHLLYKIYLSLLKGLIAGANSAKTESELLSWEQSKKKFMSLKHDYLLNVKYAREISYIEKFLDSCFSSDTMEQDPELSRIFSANYKIVLSRYAFQMLIVCVEMNGYKNISKLIFDGSAKKLVVATNPYTESYIEQGYIEDKDGKLEVETANAKGYTTGMLREFYNFLKDLEKVIQKKRLNTDKNVEVDFTDKYPVEKSSTSFMSNCPEFKNKYLVDFAKDYVNKKSLDSNHLPTVLLLNVTDREEKVTVVECNRFAKVVVLGFLTGKLKAFHLTKDSEKDYKEEYKKEFQKLHSGEDPGELLKPIIELPDFETDVESVSFIGHSAAVSTISLNYDDFYMLSGSCDGTIRLWSCKTGVCLAVYSVHVRSVWSVRFCSKGFFFASGGQDKGVYLWATNKAHPLKKFLGHSEEVTHVEFTKNLIYLVSASVDNTVRFWSIEDNSLVRIFYFENPITCFQIDEVGSTLIVGDAEGRITVWGVERAVQILKTSLASFCSNKASKAITGIDFSYDESALIVHFVQGFLVFPFQKFKEDKSKDVFSKFEKENSGLKETVVEHLNPFLEFEHKDLRILKAFFNMRNLMVLVARNFNQ